MISKKDKRFFGRIINSAYWWGGSPFVWDEKLEEFKLTDSKLGYYKWVVTSLIWVSYLFYLLWRCGNSRYYDRPLMEYNLCFCLLTAGMLPVLMNLLFITKSKDVVLCVNSSIQLDKWIHERYAKKKGMTSKNSTVQWISRGLVSISYFSKSFGVVCALMVYAKPYDYIFLMSIIPLEFRSPLLLPIIITFVTWSIISAGGSVLVIVATIGITSMVYFQSATEFNLNSRKFWTKSELRTPPHLKIGFMATSILFSLFNNFTRELIMPAQVIITRSVQVGIFVIIRHAHELPFLNLLLFRSYSTTFIFTWLIIIHFGALMNQSSCRAISSWKKKLTFKNPLEKKIWNKAMKGLRPLGIQVGDYYVMKHKTVLTTGSTFIVGTIRLLVAFKRQQSNRN